MCLSYCIKIKSTCIRSQEMARIKSLKKETAISPVIKSNYRISARSTTALCATRLAMAYRQCDNIIIHTYRNRILMQKVSKHCPTRMTIAEKDCPTIL